MAKRLLLNVLMRVLGEFIEIDESNLSLAVWSGKVVLTQLKLKADNILQKFNFVIYHGYVERLELVIPWASIMSNPLKIHLEGVFIDIGPVDLAGLDKKEILKMMIQEKLQKLKMVDQYLELSTVILNSEKAESEQQQQSSSSSSESYFQQWTSKIVDNVEMTFSNIHVRYEDSITVKGKTFACGLVQRSFSLCTCDDKWQPAFVSKTNAAGMFVNKLAEMTGFGLYWYPESTALAQLPFESWKKAMLDMVSSTEATHIQDFIVSPIGAKMSLKLTHYKRAGPTEIRFDIKLESNDLRIVIDNQQFRQMFTLYKTVTELRQIRDPTNYRPAVRPLDSREAVCQWWRYGVKLVLLRPVYIRILKKMKRAVQEGVKPDVLLTPEESTKFKAMETRLPFKVLQTFRKRAVAEFVEESRQQRGKEIKKESVHWWGLLGSEKSGSGTTVELPKEGEISLDDIIGELDRMESSNARQAFQAFRFSLSCSSNIIISSMRRHIIACHSSISLKFEKMFETITAQCDLQDLRVTDQIVVCSFHTDIITMRTSDKFQAIHAGDTNEEAKTSITVKMFGGKVEVIVHSVPLEIYVNKVIVHTLLTEFALPKEPGQVKKIKRKVKQIKRESGLVSNGSSSKDKGRNRLSMQLTEAIQKNHADIVICIQVHGPKLLIPENCVQDIGCLILDCGYIDLNCRLSAAGMVCDLKLQDINAGLPTKLSDAYALQGSSLYLIKPFNLEVQAQNADQTTADLSVRVALSPGLNGDLDPNKLARLIRIAMGITDIISPKTAPFATTASSAVLSADVSYATTPKKSQSYERMDISFASNSDAFSYFTPDPHTPNMKDDLMMMDDDYVLQTPTAGITSFLPELSQLITPTQDGKDPNTTEMLINVSIQSISLDLTYDVDTRQHILFDLKGLDLEIRNRPYDRQIDFILSNFSIQDSNRASEQAFVAWTPGEGVNLVTVSYTAMSSFASPLYETHGAILRADFAEIGLNVDTNTLLHLKPFFEVLLDKSNRITPIQSIHSVQNIATLAENTRQVSGPGAYALISVLPVYPDGPPGMKVEATLGMISLGLLRAASATDKPGKVLETAFQVKIADMRLKVDMKDLMQSTLKLRTVEIEDNRKLSKDFVFRYLFSPTAVSGSHSSSDSAAGASVTAAESADLIDLFYNQESKTQSFITVLISGISCYVAVDAMLDFALIATANFFAFTSLLSAPPAKVEAATVSEKESKGRVATTLATVSTPGTTAMNALESTPVRGSNTSSYSCYTMNATVKMVNTRLILLEDPAIHDSRAIVGQCTSEVHFTRETKTYVTRIELFESMHVSVADNEMFVLRSINAWAPVPILEPFGIELHLKRNMINGKVALTSVHVEVDDVDARLSFNDLRLFASIFSRRSLAHNAFDEQSSTPVSTVKESNVKASYDELDRIEPIPDPHTPSIMVQVGLTVLNVVIVNDFEALAIPVLKLWCEDLSFMADGLANDIKGEGSTHVKVEYFNSPCLVWEPVLDSWRPGFHVFSESKMNIFEIRSDSTLQLTFSGSMLQSLLKGFSTFFHENVRSDDRKSLTEIVVQNCLGGGIGIELRDSVAQVAVLSLADGQSGIVSAFVDPTKKTWMKHFRLPNAVDMQVIGSEDSLDQRLPLLHLPFTINKAKACMLLPAVSNDVAANKVFIVEAIEEEVYENARYDPISGTWKTPYLLGDPYQWTDSTGLVRKDMQSVEIQSDKWEWSGQWEVDMDGVVERDFDDKGWEYATSFSFFTMISARRSYQTMDGVRRRRWTRTRIPRVKEAKNRNIFRSFTIFWDVQTLPDGSRFVQVHSAFHLENHLNCSVMVELQHASWPENFLLGPTAASERVFIPLLQSYASQMRFKVVPSNMSECEWSTYFPCNIHSYDFKSAKDAFCTNTDKSDYRYFRLWTIREDKKLTVKLLPYLVVKNSLLCKMQFRIHDRAQAIVDHGEIESGASAILGSVAANQEIFLSICFGAFTWSYPLPISRAKNADGVIEMGKEGGHIADLLPISFTSRVLEDYSIELDIYFKVAMIDHSGLSLFVRSEYDRDDFIIRGFKATSPPSQYTSAPPRNPSSKALKSVATIIEDIQTLSSHPPVIIKTDIGAAVYSDVNYKWCYLSPIFRNRCSLRFAYSDRNFRSSEFCSFTLKTDSLVFVLVDVISPPRWITSSGYQNTSEVAVARRVHRNRLYETTFSIYGRVYASGEILTMGGAWVSSSPNMYSVIIIPMSEWRKDEGEFTDASQIMKQVTHCVNFNLDFASLCWSEGGNGVSAFYARDNYVQIRTESEETWSDDINIDTRKNSSTKASLEMFSDRSNITYHVAYSLQNLPGLYNKTQLITFMPRFCVLNCMEESIFIAQKGSNRHLEFKPYAPEGWHQIDDQFGFDVKLRTQSTVWSLGSVNINEMGASVLYIPYSSDEVVAMTTSASTAMTRGLVLHIEVKLANHTDHCSVIIVVWQETIESQSTMSVQNDTDLPITIRQADIELDHDLGGRERLYELVVPPGKHLPYGLCDPEGGPYVLVAVGTSLQHASKRIANLNILKVGHRLRLPYSNTSGVTKGEVILHVTASDVGHVLRISKSTLRTPFLLDEDDANLTFTMDDEFIDQSQATNKLSGSALSVLGFNLLLSSFGISLVLEKPYRREFLSLYVDGIELRLKAKGSVKTIEFSIMDMQVDNYSESAIYPIVIRSTKKEIHKSVNLDSDFDPNAANSNQQQQVADENASTIDTEKPLITLLIVSDVAAESQQPIFQRVVLRILPLAMEVDSATMQILFLDLLDDLKVLTSAQTVAINMPQKWHYDFNFALFYPGQKIINVFQVKALAQRNKMYIKKFTIHPMKVTITLYQTTLPRRGKKETMQSAVLNAMLSLAGVEKMQIRLSSFDVEDAMESIETLIALIVTKTGQDLRSQLGSIAGSLALIGSPVGFARKVGSGVKAFFYEPYLGVVEGSNDFFSGMKKGTSRLLSGVVGGAMDSAVAIVGTASKGLSYLSMDAEYVRKRALRRQQARTGQKGIYAGFKEGGESVFSGIASGVSGLIAKPIEEASKGGVKGFMKGIYLGLIGAAVKPLVGITDGISSIAYGISSEVDPNNIFVHVRPPRALEPSPLDPTVWIVVPLNLDAAYAQEFVMKRCISSKYDDRFLSYVPLSNKDEAVILSDVYIFWRRKKSLWGRVWANVSHCIPMGNALGVMLYSGAVQGNAELVVIPCGSTAVLRRLYTAVTQHVHRMGNPAKVIPPDLVDWTAQTVILQQSQQQHGDSTEGHINNEQYRRLLRDASVLGEIDGYRFGSVNGKILAEVTGSEMDAIARAQAIIQRGARSWKELDEGIWRLLWEWGCVHANLAACRCCAALLINRSDSPIQVTRVQMAMGRNVTIMGSTATGYEAESRLLWPKGYVMIFLVAFPQSPLEVGHLKATINSAAFTIVLASTQRESYCEAKGGFTTGFLEKTVSEWWCKYVIVAT